MAVLTNFSTYLDAFVDLYNTAVNNNRRRAEDLSDTIIKIVNNYNLFHVYGRDGIYITSLHYYQEMLTLMNVLPSDDAWNVTIDNLATFFGVATEPTGNEQPFQEIEYAPTVEVNCTSYKNWRVLSVTGDMLINLNNTVNGDSGMLKFTIDNIGGYTITLGTMFTEKLGSTNIDVTHDAINYITWMNVDGYITCTIDIASSLA